MQYGHMSLEAILLEVAVKRESMIKPVMIDQREAGAIDIAKLFVVVACENRLCRVFDGLGHTKDLNSCLIETFHEFNRGIVADFEADQRIGFGEDEIRCLELSVGSEQLRVDRFGDGMIIVVFVSESKKRSGIEKDFQGLDFYR